MTIDEVQKISDKALSDRVASLCGWNPKFLGYENDDGGLGRSGERYSKRPNYSQNLNAMHEVEVRNIIPHKARREFYRDTLSLLIDGGYTGGCMIYTTARQRAEAFVLTMEKK